MQMWSDSYRECPQVGVARDVNKIAPSKETFDDGDNTLQRETTQQHQTNMSDMDDIEELTFLPATETQASGSKRHKYEPRFLRKCLNVVCSKPILQAGLFVVTVIAIAVTAVLIKQMHHADTTTAAENPETPENHELKATNGEAFPWSDIRLPSFIKPLTYDIHMHPDLKAFKFSGTVDIKFELSKGSDFIVFHVKSLKVTKLEVREHGKQTVEEVVKWLKNKKHEQEYVQLSHRLMPHTHYTLSLTFQDELKNGMAGFYRSSYKTTAGQRRWIATTHFEPTDARAAFPCFDEPHMKANFSMTMTHSADYRSLFNTRLLHSTKIDQQLVKDTFEQSVRMSTYLVAFIVCDYEQNSTTTASGTKVAVHTPPGHIQQASFALHVAKVVLEYYETFFGVRYPLQKLDLVAIPDFAAGAMENWGLITYRMVALLYDSKVSTTQDKQWVAVVIAHEIAHQWFGNLVTMNWWNDLWLNEGFASFVEYIGTNRVKPEWKMMELFISGKLTRALYKDSLASSHPISVPVHDPAEINEIFDAISYDKGSSIIRMLESFLGMDTLKKGLQQYLKKFAYGNAVTDDLWNTFSDEMAKQTNKLSATVDIKAVMATWTAQMGYPVVTLTQTGQTVVASQKRFLLDETDNSTSKFTSPYGYKWYIPLTYCTDTAPQKLIWMNKAGVSFDIPKAKWLKANVNMTGFYRVQYSDSNWQALIQQLKLNHRVFSSADRANLLEDAFALARSAHLKLNVAMEMSTYLQKETEYLPWTVALRSLLAIEDLFELTPAYKFYATYILKLLDNQLKTIKWEDTGSHLEKYLRIRILKEALRLNHEPSVKKAMELYDGWKNKTISLSADLKDIVYQASIRYGGAADWTLMWQQYKKATMPAEKQALLNALAYTTDANTIQRFLAMSLDENEVRRGDSAKVVRMIAAKPAGRVIAWQFVKEHWDVFYKRYGAGSFTMTSLIVTTAGGFSSGFYYKEVEAFFKSHDPGSGKRAVAEALEKIRKKTAWKTQHTQPMTEWLKQHTA